MRPLLLLTLLLMSLPTFAEISATVDRMTVSEFDLVTLTVRVTNESTKKPDLSGITRDFEIVSQRESTSTSLSIGGGRQQSSHTTTYALSLRPKRQGNLVIPAINIGSSSTRAIPITVSATSAARQQRDISHVFFENSVDQQSAYVQSQIIYSLKLFYADSVGGDFPAPPVLTDAVVQSLEGERRFVSEINNQRYNVLEKRYAIYPQKSGTLTIPREVFRGVRGRGGFFGQREQVTAVSDAITVDIKPKPTAFTGTTWIAARSFNLTERWTEQPPQFKVGEPVNRILSMHAVGLTGSLLPPFDPIELANIKTYADPTTTSESTSTNGIASRSETTIGIVPIKPGELTLPEIRIPWWNTKTDREEFAIIPAATYDVLPVEGIVLVPTATAPLTQAAQPQVIQEALSPWWMVLTIALGILWLFSSWQWLHLCQALREYKNEEPNTGHVLYEPNEDALFKDLGKACKANKASEAHRCLSLWSQARFKTESLQALQSQLKNDALDKEITNLENVLYADNTHQAWQGSELLSITKILRQQKGEKHAKHDLLTELNPT
ncbi:MAG: BatD family protein [Pseudomonadales bacterium]|nr:BatD family protein [Pseudomonadales bacterium]